MLDPDVVFWADRGRLVVPDAPPLVTGATAVAEQILVRGRNFAGFARPAIVNGAAGLVVIPRDRAIAVIAFAVTDGRISEIDLVADPDKLARLDLGLG